MTTERCPDCGTKLNRVRKSLRTIAPEDGRRRLVTELSFFCPKCEETLDQVFWEDDPYSPCVVCYYRPACDAPPADCGAKNNFREFKTIVDTLPCGCPVGAMKSLLTQSNANSSKRFTTVFVESPLTVEEALHSS
jgi:hypothetical protein